MMRRFVTTVISLTALSLMPGDATAQRRLTAADLPPLKLDTSAIRKLAAAGSKDLLKSILVAPSSDAVLRRALAKAGPEWAPGGELAQALKELSGEAAEAILQRMQNETVAANFLPTPARGRSDRLADAAFPSSQTLQGWRTWHATSPAVAMGFAIGRELPASVFAPRGPVALETFTIFAETEFVGGGNTMNVRMETTMIYGKRVGVRIYKRTTIEKNGDPSAVARYFVELGTAYPGTGKRELDNGRKTRPSRLKTTGLNRATTVELREAAVDRCPDAGGLSRGQTTASFVFRATAAFVGGTAPYSLELLSEGAAVGNVDDAATLLGFDVEVKTDYKEQDLGAGIDLRVGRSLKYGLNTGGDGFRSNTGPYAVTGTGRENDGEAIASLIDASTMDANPLVLQAFDTAEEYWRGEKCLEVVVASGAQPSKLGKGETRRIVVDARHLDEPAVPKIPVTGEPSGGTLSPKQAAITPGARFAFTATAPNGGGGATFRSVSKRGIAKPAAVSFSSDTETDSLSILFTMPGITELGDDHVCPNNLDVFEGKVVAGMRDGPRVYYAGRARRTSKLEACLMGKETVDRESQPCKMLLTGSADVLLTITTGWSEAGASIDWKPVPSSVKSNVVGDCEPSASTHMRKEYAGNRGTLFRGLPPGPLNPRVYVDSLSLDEPLKLTLVVGKVRQD